MRFVDTNILLYAVSTDAVEAARVLGCGTVLSEDLADGRDYAGVHIENPFRSTA